MPVYAANIVANDVNIPDITDTSHNVAGVADLMRRLGLDLVHLLPYHRIAGEKYRRLGMECLMGTTRPPSEPQMEALREEFERQGIHAKTGG